MQRLLLTVVAPVVFAASAANAQTTTKDLTKVSAHEYVRLCALSENAHPCLHAIYVNATVNRLLDAIKNQKSFCPTASRAFPPDDIVARVVAWLRLHPASLYKQSSESLSAALVAMYPCR